MRTANCKAITTLCVIKTLTIADNKTKAGDK